MSKKTTPKLGSSKPLSAAKATQAAVKKDQKPSLWPAHWEKWSLYVIVALALVALVLKLQNLGYLSFWVDEYWHAGRTKAFLAGGAFKDLFAVETNGAVVTLLAVIFGGVLGESEFSLRLPIVLGAVALLPAVYFFVRRNIAATPAVLAVLLLAFSPYLFFWSRVCRMYGLVPTTFFVLLLAFMAFYENGSLKEDTQRNDTTLSDLSWKWIMPLIGVFILSFFTSQISFLFFFCLGLYAILMMLHRLFVEKVRPVNLKDKYVLVSMVSIPVFILSFTPLNQLMARPVFLKLMPPHLVDKILPDMSATSALLASEDSWRVFNTFLNVLKTDFPTLYWWGFIGIILSFFYSKRLGYFFVSFFVFPFLLLGFVFINMNLAKYMSFIYPMYAIAIALGLYGVPDLLLRKVFKLDNNFSFVAKMIFSFVIALALIPFSTIKTLAFETKHGNVIDGKLAEWFFTNWKEPMQLIKAQPGFEKDLMVSTMPEAVKYYSGAKEVLFFRQNQYDVYKKEYVPNKPSGSTESASSYDDFVATFNAHPRGWLIADYYFYNAMTDPRARFFVMENTTFHPEACPDGSVQVFSWDKSKQRVQPGNLVIELGKPLGRQMSDPMSFNLSNLATIPALKLNITSKFIDAQNEAFLSVNGGQFLPVSLPITTDANGYGLSTVYIPKNVLREGANQIVFAYNPDALDTYKGFVVYNIDIGM